MYQRDIEGELGVFVLDMIQLNDAGACPGQHSHLRAQSDRFSCFLP